MIGRTPLLLCEDCSLVFVNGARPAGVTGREICWPKTPWSDPGHLRDISKLVDPVRPMPPTRGGPLPCPYKGGCRKTCEGRKSPILGFGKAPLWAGGARGKALTQAAYFSQWRENSTFHTAIRDNKRDTAGKLAKTGGCRSPGGDREGGVRRRSQSGGTPKGGKPRGLARSRNNQERVTD